MWTSRIAAFAAFAILSVAVAPLAVAQSSQDGAALLASGEKSLADGKHAIAVQQLSRAMRSESLSSEQVAMAFYQRGKAYRELGKHALAVADFTNALWIKGLPAAEQKQAETARAEAYAALGQQDHGDTVVAQGSSAPSAPAIGAFETRVEPQATPAPRPAQTQIASAAPARTPEPVGAFQTRVEAAAPSRPAHTQVASAAPAATADSIGAFQTQVESAAAPPPVKSEPSLFSRLRASIAPSEASGPAEPETTAAIAQLAPPAAPQPARPRPEPSWSTSVAPSEPTQVAAAAPEAQQEQEGSRIGRFFGGLRGSLRSEEPGGATSAPAETTAAAAPAAASGQWSASTTVGEAKQQGAAEAGETGRSYRLQLASVRSAEDAQATWQQIADKHQDLVGGRQPLIEKTELGSLGTVYRVQIGPFADKRESLQLCNAFKAGGVDCFLVTR